MKQIKKTEQGIHGNLNVSRPASRTRRLAGSLTLLAPRMWQALQAIVGGILRDPRVFHMDAPDWLELLQLQGASLHLARRRLAGLI